MTKQEIVKNQGQIKHLTVPLDWREIKSHEIGGSQYIREFAPADRDDIKLIFYYRGKRVDQESGENFLKVLALPEHELSQDERQRVEWIIRNASEPDWFATRSLRTEHVNKKKSLVMEGTWLADNSVDLGLFFDTDKTGTAIQEIHYTAPEADYQAFLPIAVSAIKSIVWK
jgi:hypothetical protein